MAITQEQFRRRLTDSGIVSAAELAAMAEGPSAEEAVDPGELAEALVAAGRLTSFQAAALLDETARPLRLGNYLLLDTVGAGGMGQVYKAVHERMKRVVALKVLPPFAAANESLVARFRREVEVAAKLDHPGIVTAYDADEADGRHYLVMELVDGRDLEAVVEAEGPLAIDRALDTVRQAAVALAYAHGEGVLHRDVKPSNLLVDADGQVKVLDLGLAHLDAADGLTTTGDVIGSAHTMAPEQGDDIRLADARSDVYALGCTLFYLLTGRHVYEGESALNVLLAHARNPIPRLSDMRPDVPAEVEQLFEGMVQKAREDRYPSMAAVIEALDALRAGDAPPPPPAPRRRRRSRVPRRVLVVGALVLAALGTGLALTLGGAFDGAPEVGIVGATYHSTLRGHADSVYALALHPDGQRVLSGCADGTIGVWSLEDGTLLQSLAGHEAEVRSVLVSRDGRTVYSASSDTTIRIWDLERGAVRQVLTGHEAKARKIALAPDETWLASASKDGTLRIWDLPGGTERAQRREHAVQEGDNRGLLCVDVRSDGAALATTAYDRTVKLWETEDFRVRATLGPHGSDVGIVLYSPDGRHLLYDLANGRVRVTTADGAEEVAVLASHLEWVYAIAFSADGRTVATGSQDMSIKLWRFPEGRLIDTLTGHEDTVNALAFTADGTRLVSGSADDTLRIWDLRRGPLQPE